MSVDIQLRHDVADIFAAYAACIDCARYDDWPEFFTENAWYRIVARENYDRNLPLSTLSLKGKAMMKDRNYGVESTIFHAPYYQRHVVGLPMIEVDSDGLIRAEANYAVFRTKRDMPSEIFSVGRYVDILTYQEGSLKFSQKFCVFDNDLIPNSLIYPI